MSRGGGRGERERDRQTETDRQRQRQRQRKRQRERERQREGEMGWWLSVSGWIYFDLSFTGALFYHVFLTVSIKEASVNPFMSLLYIIIPVRMRIKGC